MTPETMYYQLGRRDATAELLMLCRTKDDPAEALKELATEYLKTDPDNPHAKYWTTR